MRANPEDIFAKKINYQKESWYVNSRLSQTGVYHLSDIRWKRKREGPKAMGYIKHRSVHLSVSKKDWLLKL
jgi:hypothetical protein